jgi:small subunit ribosomal protein S18
MAKRMKRETSERRSRSHDRDNDEGFGAKRKARHLEGIKVIDPNDYDLIRRFLTEHGKLMPARLTGATAKQQREIKRIVRRLRVMGIVP